MPPCIVTLSWTRQPLCGFFLSFAASPFFYVPPFLHSYFHCFWPPTPGAPSPTNSLEALFILLMMRPHGTCVCCLGFLCLRVCPTVWTDNTEIGITGWGGWEQEGRGWQRNGRRSRRFTFIMYKLPIQRIAAGRYIGDLHGEDTGSF